MMIIKKCTIVLTPVLQELKRLYDKYDAEGFSFFFDQIVDNEIRHTLLNQSEFELATCRLLTDVKFTPAEAMHISNLTSNIIKANTNLLNGLELVGHEILVFPTGTVLLKVEVKTKYTDEIRDLRARLSQMSVKIKDLQNDFIQANESLGRLESLESEDLRIKHPGRL